MDCRLQPADLGVAAGLLQPPVLPHRHHAGRAQRRHHQSCHHCLHHGSCRNQLHDHDIDHHAEHGSKERAAPRQDVPRVRCHQEDDQVLTPPPTTNIIVIVITTNIIFVAIILSTSSPTIINDDSSSIFYIAELCPALSFLMSVFSSGYKDISLEAIPV